MRVSSRVCAPGAPTNRGRCGVRALAGFLLDFVGMDLRDRGTWAAFADPSLRLVCGIALVAAVALPFSMGGCSESGGTGGEGGAGGIAGTGGSGGAAGFGGLGGSGGAIADCTLATEWETTGSWGSEALAYGNVVLMQNALDGSLWQAVSRTHLGETPQYDIALFRSGDGGSSWAHVSTWDFPAERRGWANDAVMIEDGTVYVVLREYTFIDGAVGDRYVRLLRYPPGGSLVEAGTFSPDGSTDTRSVTMAARGGTPYFIAFNAAAVPPDYHIVKYENGVLESVDIVRYLNETNEIYLRDIAVAPNGKLWTAGQGYDTGAAAWRATIWEEGDSGFSLLAELNAKPAVKESDTVMALAFDADDRFWTSYYTMPHFPDLIRRWRAGYGAVDAPDTSFGLNDDFSLDPSKASDTNRIVVHPSGAVFTGGYAIDADSWQWGIVRKGATAGFEISDKFIRGGDGTYRTDMSSMLVDEDKNVWVAYMSRPAVGWSPKWTTIRKLPCVR